MTKKEREKAKVRCFIYIGLVLEFVEVLFSAEPGMDVTEEGCSGEREEQAL